MTKLGKCDVIVVAWNCEDSITPLIESCLSQTNLSKLIIVNNDSEDNTSRRVKEFSDERIILIESSHNLGFGGGCNLGMMYTSGEYILFLNPDTLLYEGALQKAIEEFELQKADVLGVKMVDEYGNTHRSSSRFPTLTSIINESSGFNKIFPRVFQGYFMSDWDHEETRVVDHVIGAFYLLKRQAMVDIGMMDKRFFVYYEDLDLSKRISDAGGRIVYSASLKIFHEGGGTSKSVKARRNYYSMRSRVMYVFKHLGKLKGYFYLIYLLTVERLLRSLFFFVKGDYESLKETQESYRLYKRYMRGENP